MKRCLCLLLACVPSIALRTRVGPLPVLRPTRAGSAAGWSRHPVCPRMELKTVATAVESSEVAKTLVGSTKPAAWSELEWRVANSRVEPILRSMFEALSGLFTGTPAKKGSASRIWEALWQPLDLICIALLIWGSSPVLRALHARAQALRSAGEGGNYLSSWLEALETPLRRTGGVLAALFILDAVVYICGVRGVMTKKLAGALPAAVADFTTPVLAATFVDAIKSRHFLRKEGVRAGATLQGDSALADRLWGAAVWLGAGWWTARIMFVHLGFRVRSLLAIGGASSLIFATACLTPLSNLVQGLVIAVSRPFATGDKISIGSMSPLIGLDLSGRPAPTAFDLLSTASPPLPTLRVGGALWVVPVAAAHRQQRACRASKLDARQGAGRQPLKAHLEENPGDVPRALRRPPKGAPVA